MRLTTRCSIALHCLIFIAEYQDQIKVTGDLLSKSTGCNPAEIRGILGMLQKEGFISITRGVGGAYLCREPEMLTLWEIFHAVDPDGLDKLFGFHPHPSEACPVGQRIRNVLHKPYQDVGAAVREAMEKTTLQRLLEDYHTQESPAT